MPPRCPRSTCTVWSNVFMLAALQPGETLLVHGGAGGIGTMAIQLAHALGAKVATTVGSEEKASFCRELGADLTVNYREQQFVEEVRRFDGSGADVVLDHIGAKYLSPNVDVLATEGRLVVIGLMGGRKAELDLGTLMRQAGCADLDSAPATPGRGQGRDRVQRRGQRLAAHG